MKSSSRWWRKDCNEQIRSVSVSMKERRMFLEKAKTAIELRQQTYLESLAEVYRATVVDRQNNRIWAART
jgi:hypothetical protein